MHPSRARTLASFSSFRSAASTTAVRRCLGHKPVQLSCCGADQTINVLSGRKFPSTGCSYDKSGRNSLNIWRTMTTIANGHSTCTDIASAGSPLAERSRHSSSDSPQRNGASSHIRSPPRRVYVALGSNMGDRLDTIERACRELEAEPGIKLKRTSGLWQTRAMYMTDQDDFLNGVVEIETNLAPLALLDRLQLIENKLGRKRLVEKGPRTLDLDIILDEAGPVDHERLRVPHELMLERQFVLQPICELIPHGIIPDSEPKEQITIAQHLRMLGPPDPPMSPMTPLSKHTLPLGPLHDTRTTRVMSILNVTPDSFSDGGLHDPSDATYLEQTIRSHLYHGATIIDIGGQSTRPHAKSITAEEEIQRTVPAIKAARQLMEDPTQINKAAISIDTYRAEVARAAVEAGADIVNDVSGGLLDKNMFGTMANLGCTVVLMHTRGTPETMSNKENTTYEGDLLEVIADELLERVHAAEEAGIRRWRIILDPGIGFAKTAAQNLEILRRFEELRQYAARKGLRGIPWLIGSSRKGFVGKITGVKEADERSWGTAATVAAAVQGGADVVRVHDVDEMGKVAKMSDAIWRTGTTTASG